MEEVAAQMEHPTMVVLLSLPVLVQSTSSMLLDAGKQSWARSWELDILGLSTCVGRGTRKGLDRTRLYKYPEVLPAVVCDSSAGNWQAPLR